MLNNIYGKIYNYEKSIKPAPNPFYTLDKYHGNLSINEYRKLLFDDRLLLVVDKPLTKIVPELYEENNEVPNIYSNLLTIDNVKKTYRLKFSILRTPIFDIFLYLSSISITAHFRATTAFLGSVTTGLNR